MNQENQISESWEDIDESELEARLEKEKQDRLKQEQEMASAAANQQNGLTLMNGGTADDFRPRILQRPSPKVTILKRPESSSANSQAQNAQNAANRTQIKSLEQREKEYAEARLRILGSATEPTTTCDEFPPPSGNQQPPRFTQKPYPPPYNPQQPPTSDQQQLSSLDNVVRLPRGPQPGQGFNIRR